MEDRNPGEVTTGRIRVVQMVGEARGKRCQVESQSPARVEIHSGVEGGRSHGGDFLDAAMVTTDGDSANGGARSPRCRQRTDGS